MNPVKLGFCVFLLFGLLHAPVDGQTITVAPAGGGDNPLGVGPGDQIFPPPPPPSPDTSSQSRGRCRGGHRGPQ